MLEKFDMDPCLQSHQAVRDNNCVQRVLQYTLNVWSRGNEQFCFPESGLRTRGKTKTN